RGGRRRRLHAGRPGGGPQPVRRRPLGHVRRGTRPHEHGDERTHRPGGALLGEQPSLPGGIVHAPLRRRARRPERKRGHRMSAFNRPGTLVRCVARRDRVRLSVWILALVGTVAATIPALDEMFTTEAERQGRAALMGSPTGVVFGGPGYGLADYALGPLLVNALTMSLISALAIMSI